MNYMWQYLEYILFTDSQGNYSALKCNISTGSIMENPPFTSTHPPPSKNPFPDTKYRFNPVSEEEKSSIKEDLS
jgi:hypothetical protein